MRPQNHPARHVTINQFAGQKLGMELKGLISIVNQVDKKTTLSRVSPPILIAWHVSIL